MTDKPTLGLAIIAKDEEENLPHLLESIEGAFDQVVLVDTGSSDRTVEVFEEWAGGQAYGDEPARCSMAKFEWQDDFSAARNFAQEQLDADWIAWADADDRLEGADKLRQLAAEAPDEVGALVFDYDYAHDEHGNVSCRLRRERLVRRGRSHWAGAIHEAQHVDGAQQVIGRELARWVHRKQDHASSDRNISILERWHEREPTNPRVLQYLGAEYLSKLEHEKALEWYALYWEVGSEWAQEKAQVCRRMSVALAALDDDPAAERQALTGLAIDPTWSDNHLTMAEVAYRREQWQAVLYWAQAVIELGEPTTMLITNPLDYTVTPRVLRAGALGAIGNVDEAIAVADEALAIADVPLLGEPYAGWRGTRKRERVARTFVESARVLVAHDEQLKALSLLKSAPYFVTDHATVVAFRSQLRERLEPLIEEQDEYDRHYETGGTKPEDLVPDDRLEEVAGNLPRAAFLRDQITELAEEVAA